MAVLAPSIAETGNFENYCRNQTENHPQTTTQEDVLKNSTNLGSIRCQILATSGSMSPGGSFSPILFSEKSQNALSTIEARKNPWLEIF